MEAIKVFADAIILLAAFIGAVIYLKATMKDTIKEVNKEDFEEVHDNLTSLEENMKKEFAAVNERLESSRLDMCRNFLIHAMVDIERGIADESLIHRFWDVLDYYHEKRQNSYIDTRVQALIDTGKLKPRLK